jgi:hypothetical protein
LNRIYLFPLGGDEEAARVQTKSVPELKRTSSAALARNGSSCVLSLGAIKRASAARWEKTKRSIHERVETLLRQKLGPSDFFIQIDETSYLISIPAVDGEEAQVCCLRIAYELHTGLLGPCTIAQLQIGAAVAVADDALEVTPIVAPQILTLAERAGLDDLVATSRPGADGKTARRPSPAKLLSDDLVHRFVPIWDARAEAISAYRCIVEPIEFGAEPATPNGKARAALRLAQAALQISAAALEIGIERGERFLVHVRVPFETLTSPIARMEFVSACRGLSHDLRPYLVFEIADLPVGVPQSRLNELVTTIRAFGRGVTAEVALRNPTLAMYQGIGLHAIGLNLSAPQDSLTKIEIERLGLSARRLGLLAFLSDVPTPALVAFARDAGVQWMSGPAIARPVMEPGPMIRLYTDEILQVPHKARA